MCISIATVEDDWPKINKVQQMGLLQIYFADADHPAFAERAERMGSKFFNEDHANQILDFVNKHWDETEYFFAHCEAGQSRSPAVVAAIMKIKGYDESCYFKIKSPNAHVYRTILEVAHKRGEYGPTQEEDMPDVEKKFNE
jgi:predicted protein tyrosine phosphatase